MTNANDLMTSRQNPVQIKKKKGKSWNYILGEDMEEGD